MKLRFHSGTLRLRLSQSDVARLVETGRIEETMLFPQSRGLTYAIELADGAEIVASFIGDRIEITVPAAVGRNWIASDQAGIENLNATPKLLIEKDYRCAHQEGSGEMDAFPNPMMDKF